MSNAIVIAEYEEIEKMIDEVAETANFLPDVSSKEGYEKSKRVSLDIGKVLTSLEGKRKDKKAFYLEGGKQVDTQAKAIAAKLEEIQAPHKLAYKELDALKKEREQARKDALEERVQTIRNMPELMAESDSTGIKMALDGLHKEECLDFYEYTEQALKARNASREALGDMFAKALKAEKDQAELAELRKKQAEQEQEERDEAIRREAAAKAEAEKAEAEKAKQEAIEQAAEAVRQREEAEKNVAIQKELNDERERQAKIDAEAQAKQAAEDAKQEEIARQNAKIEADKEVQRKLEANKKHVGAVRKAAKESFMAIGFSEADAKKAVLAIANNKIENVSINL